MLCKVASQYQAEKALIVGPTGVGPVCDIMPEAALYDASSGFLFAGSIAWRTRLGKLVDPSLAALVPGGTEPSGN
jgi:hypothetical protein